MGNLHAGHGIRLCTCIVSQVCWLGCFLCVGCFLSFFLTWSAAFNDSVLQVLDYRIFIGSKREELTKKSSEAASVCMVQCFSRHAFKKVFKEKPIMINESWGILSSSAHTRMGYTESVLMETIPNQTFRCYTMQENAFIIYWLGERVFSNRTVTLLLPSTYWKGYKELEYDNDIGVTHFLCSPVYIQSVKKPWFLNHSRNQSSWKAVVPTLHLASK